MGGKPCIKAVHRRQTVTRWSSCAQSVRGFSGRLHQNRYIETNMVDTVENLILDLLEWVGRWERTYQETMEAWRTSCPRLPVWEDSTDCGLVEIQRANGRASVRVTAAGIEVLES